MAKDYLFLCLVVLQVMPHAFVNGARYLKSDRLCSQCSKCDTSECPPSEAYPHMTAFDDTLIAGLAIIWINALGVKAISQWTCKAK
ncbi:hypothetical protein CMV_028894 [Castanea mollissima]|uniref:Uncharacterized protein n=1 Tax=Castanea mollissima TaxID=60419 RepID=A0A8J4VDX5_9ROSI|nr:hypothetical protein CMV_028894 [Castanea mollissima]